MIGNSEHQRPLTIASYVISAIAVVLGIIIIVWYVSVQATLIEADTVTASYEY